MSKIVIEIIVFLIQAVVASVAIVAIVKLDTSLPLKAIISVAIVLALLLLSRLPSCSCSQRAFVLPTSGFYFC